MQVEGRRIFTLDMLYSMHRQYRRGIRHSSTWLDTDSPHPETANRVGVAVNRQILGPLLRAWNGLGRCERVSMVWFMSRCIYRSCREKD